MQSLPTISKHIWLVFILLVEPINFVQADNFSPPKKADSTVRVATYNTAFSRDETGALLAELETDSQQAKRIAGVIRTVRPDVILLNEFDYEPGQESVKLFLSKYLQAPQGIGEPITYEYYYAASVNTGEPSGLDLDNNGRTSDPNDAFGFGRYPGHYGMVILSKFPIVSEDVRTFQKFLWSSLPNAQRPMVAETNKSFYSDEIWTKLRLSSKSHWDVPIQTPVGKIHFLCSHPTPPAFDGPEDRNGKRNHDEIRLWKEYIENPTAPFLVDDQGNQSGLPSGASFVVLGDLNADPKDGDDRGLAIRQLLESPQVDNTTTPRAEGGSEAAVKQGNKNLSHRGAPHEDTSDFNDRAPGNLRVDYALPSTTLQVMGAGVFWPTMKQIEATDPKWMEASDHRLVWIDVKPK
jgi:endonuclease/exonuclease/phosphatase family metal-dependent hydrolase